MDEDTKGAVDAVLFLYRDLLEQCGALAELQGITVRSSAKWRNFRHALAELVAQITFMNTELYAVNSYILNAPEKE